MQISEQSGRLTAVDRRFSRKIDDAGSILEEEAIVPYVYIT